MISEESKISVAMDLINEKIGEFMVKKRKSKDEANEEEYNKLLLEREEIYKGNYEIINKIIKEKSEKND